MVVCERCNEAWVSQLGRYIELRGNLTRKSSRSRFCDESDQQTNVIRSLGLSVIDYVVRAVGMCRYRRL